MQPEPDIEADKRDIRHAAVHVAENSLERERIQRFRYDVQVRELGLQPPGTDFETETVVDPLDDYASHVFVTAGDTIAATLRVATSPRMPWPLPPELVAHYGLADFIGRVNERISFSTGLVVAGEWRGTQLPALLTGAAFKVAHQAGSRFDFTNCAPALVGLYEKLGYRRYTEAFNDGAGALKVPLVLALDDIVYLNRINSPFARMAETRSDGHEVAAWFHEAFPDAVGHQPNRLRQEQDFWGYLTRKLHQSPMHGIALFSNMSYPAVREFLREANILYLKQGDFLSRRGEVSDAMYVIVSGRLFVRPGRGAQVVAKLSAGDVVGEISYLTATEHTADIEVAQDTEVLVLTQSVFRRLMERSPEISAKVLFNLSLVLCQRLRATTELLNGPLAAMPPLADKPAFTHAPDQRAAG
jgi:CRP-like cAMP-binding protein/predicted GNAT family N-acyltransferase